MASGVRCEVALRCWARQDTTVLTDPTSIRVSVGDDWDEVDATGVSPRRELLPVDPVVGEVSGGRAGRAWGFGS